MHICGRKGKGPPQGSPGLWGRRASQTAGQGPTPSSQSGRGKSTSNGGFHPHRPLSPAAQSHTCPRVQGQPSALGRPALLLEAALTPPSLHLLRQPLGAGRVRAAVGCCPLQGRSKGRTSLRTKERGWHPTPLLLPGVPADSCPWFFFCTDPREWG